MARRRRGRNVNGIVLLDKPQDISSNDALQKVRRLFNAAKAGHTGALDPLATGMLPVPAGFRQALPRDCPPGAAYGHLRLTG